MLRLGFDVGGTKVAAGLIDDNWQVRHKLSRRFPRGRDGTYLADMMLQMGRELCREAEIAPADLTRVGAALPGTLDAENGIVIDAYNLGFHDLPLLQLLQQRFTGADLSLCNDADAAARAELAAGALQGCSCGLLLTLGTGLGGGIVSQGRLFPGGQNRGVEIGHMLLHKGGRLCSCGQRGCAECYCSATALARAGRRAAMRYPDSLLARRCRGRIQRISAKLVTDCVQEGDPAAVEVFDAYLDELASAIASLVNIMDPQVIALGGGLGQCGELLCQPLRSRVADRCFHHSCGRIVPAALGNDAGLIGAVLPQE